MLRWYQAHLTRRPVLVQSVSSAVLFCAGDLLAQQAVEQKGADHDSTRTARMLLYGGAIFGPLATNWYRVLQRINLTTKTRTILARVALDQAVFTPTHMILFLSTMALFPSRQERITSVGNKQPMERVKDRLHSTYWTAISRNYMVWPWVQLANFSIVPLEHRVLVVNVVALGWNCYLSWLNSSHSQGQSDSDSNPEVVGGGRAMAIGKDETLEKEEEGP